MKMFNCDRCGQSVKFYDCVDLTGPDKSYTLCWSCATWFMGEIKNNGDALVTSSPALALKLQEIVKQPDFHGTRRHKTGRGVKP